MTAQAEFVTQTQERGASIRTRTYSWIDPSVNLAALGRATGLETLRMILTGELPPPPITQTLGYAALEFDEGRAVFTMRAGEHHYNPLGTVHGGAIATLLDTCTGCAVHTTLPAGLAYTSLDLTTKFLRPVTVESGLLRCEGTVISRGRTTALAEARLTDEDGRLMAYATSTCLIFSQPA
jgi:uncharacterized protein (TIGR00369 family)